MSGDEEQIANIFEEPGDYYRKTPSHTFQAFYFADGTELRLRLVGQSPLWGHHLWQGGTIVAQFLERNSSRYVDDLAVLELGAGGGLPSLVAAFKGAKAVVMTDYPENQLTENLQFNINHCLPGNLRRSSILGAEGYLWGADPTPLLRHLGNDCSQRFDTLILADLLFNHSCHASLLKTIVETLRQAEHASALVFFTPYRPWLFEKDMAFFTLVRQDPRLKVSDIGKWMVEKIMFEQDQGDETLRRTVFGFEIKWDMDALVAA